MIDKITSKIKRYPFQTGILLGFVICLVLIGFISLFQDNGKTLSGNTEVIREDYLRMTIHEFSDDRDPQLAGWRFGHLGRSGDETLKLMSGDETVSPQLLAKFAEAVGKEDVLKKGTGNNGTMTGTPGNMKKEMSVFGKTMLIVLGLIVVSAGGLYAASLVKTRRKQQMRSERKLYPDGEDVNVITPEKARAVNSDIPDTLFDLDELFPQKNESEEKPENTDTKAALNFKDQPVLDNDITEVSPEKNNGADDNNDETDPEIDNASEAVEDEPEPEPEQENETFDEDAAAVQAEDDLPDEAPEDTGSSISGLNIETSVHDIGDQISLKMDESADDVSGQSMRKSEPEDEEDLQENDNADKPLVETDIRTDPNSDDELLQMIRGSKTNSDALEETEPAEKPAEKNVSDPDAVINEEKSEDTDDDEEEEDDDILIHYQSSYRIGNDMYDEVFSIDQGDVFRGECGISIGETLNNTEPKAVTAFEVWLFDKDDIHTTTWYLMSDFALSNESISERLLQHGKCERIRRNGKYTLETETLTVEITVLDLEYGTEMEEKNSYFMNVTFDVVARSKN